MADVEPNDICAVALVGDVGGTDEVVQAYQFRGLANNESMSAAEAFDDWEEIFQAAWTVIRSLFSLSVVFRSMRARNITKQTLLGEQGLSVVLQGLDAGDQAPFQCTIPVAFLTSTPRVILKKMLGPCADSAFGEDGYVSGASLIVAASYASYMMASLVATNGSWVYGLDSPIAMTWIRPISAVASRAPGALGRRRAGRGS